MKNTFKKTLPLLALSLCLASSSYAMDSKLLRAEYPSSSGSVMLGYGKTVEGVIKFEGCSGECLVREYKTPRGVQVLYGEDKSPHSASMYMEATNKQSSSGYTRRILSLDGGGLRGLYEIVILAVLESIMNSDHNPNYQGKSLRISDYFDVVGGTSTGSILAAGLLSRHDYSALDLFYLYGRYGYKIFDEQRRSMRGLNGAIYDANGVDDLLVMHFGKDTLQDIKRDKRLYVIGFDAEDQEAMVYTSHVMPSPIDSQYENHKTPMVEAIGVSTAAPVYFPARRQIKNKKTVLMKDGGLVANDPAYLIYQSETKEIPANYEIYSLGTGLVPATAEAGDHGYLGAAKVIEEVFAAQVSAVERNCREAIEDANSELRYYVRLQVMLEAGMGDMDNTSPEYIQYAIDNALEVTKGPVFMRSMLEHLGIKAPSLEEMELIHSNLRNNVKYSLPSYKNTEMPIFQQLTSYRNEPQTARVKLEHEFLLKKIGQRDMDFYVNMRDAHGTPIPAGKKEECLQALIADYVKNNSSGYLATFASWFGYETPEAVQEMVMRGAEFHQLSKPKAKLTKDEIHSGISYAYAMNLFAEFQDCLDSGKYKYERTTFGSKASYFDTVATIYWKNKFHEIRTTIGEDKLQEYQAALLKHAQEHVTKNSSTGIHFLATTFRGSNAVDLVANLAKCIKEKTL